MKKVNMNFIEKVMENPKKYLTRLAIGLGALIIGLNSYIVVQDGSVVTQTFLGKVNPNIITPGFHFVNPIASYDTFSTKDIAMKFEALQVPSQDKFKSTVDITVMLQFDGNKAPVNKVNAGNQDQALDRYVTEKLLSTIREFGKSVPKAQDLFDSKIQNELQIAIQQEVEEYARPYGYTVKQVFLQDITLPEVIMTQVTNTKVREEQVNAELANLKKAEAVAQQKVKQAEAEREARNNEAQANERDADARLYSAQKEAEANKALQQTITPEMLKWKQLDVDMLRAKAYKGDVPQTVVGATYDGQMIMDMRSKN
ncbi:lipopritein [Proteus phage J3S]